MIRVSEAEQAFEGLLGCGRVRRDVDLGPMTTFKVGGAAEWFFETARAADVGAALRAARSVEMPVTVLGGGSNVLVGGQGVAGLVIRIRHGAIHQLRSDIVRVDAGVSLNQLVRWTVHRGLAGLEGWAGTPGTVGGALHGNAHFQGRMIGAQIVTVGLVDPKGATRAASSTEMAFAYDESRLARTGEVALWADVAVTAGDPADLRVAAHASLAYRKRTQPLSCRSAGCIFRNPDPSADILPEGVPASAGALIDRAGLKGARIGGASVSPVHANFVVSDGTASPRDIRELIERCRAAVRERFNVWLKDEIIYLGEF